MWPDVIEGRLELLQKRGGIVSWERGTRQASGFEWRVVRYGLDHNNYFELYGPHDIEVFLAGAECGQRAEMGRMSAKDGPSDEVTELDHAWRLYSVAVEDPRHIEETISAWARRLAQARRAVGLEEF